MSIVVNAVFVIDLLRHNRKHVALWKLCFMLGAFFVQTCAGRFWAEGRI